MLGPRRNTKGRPPPYDAPPPYQESQIEGEVEPGSCSWLVDKDKQEVENWLQINNLSELRDKLFALDFTTMELLEGCDDEDIKVLIDELGLRLGKKIAFKQAMKRLQREEPRRKQCVISEVELEFQNNIERDLGRLQEKIKDIDGIISNLQTQHSQHSEQVNTKCEELTTEIQRWRYHELDVLQTNFALMRNKCAEYAQRLRDETIFVEESLDACTNLISSSNVSERRGKIQRLSQDVHEKVNRQLELQLPDQLKCDFVITQRCILSEKLKPSSPPPDDRKYEDESSNVWWYYDNSEVKQGPFSQERMRLWWNKKFLTAQLLVCDKENGEFQTLESAFRRGLPLFLSEVPSEFLEGEVVRRKPRRKDELNLPVRCLCQTEMTKLFAKDAYGQFSGISCDGCADSIRGLTLVYHCERKKVEEHMQGYDLCLKCAKKCTAMMCSCGAWLIQRQAALVFAFGSAVLCNECRVVVAPDENVFHCPVGKPNHPSCRVSYDLCRGCALQTQRDRQQCLKVS